MHSLHDPHPSLWVLKYKWVNQGRELLCDRLAKARVSVMEGAQLCPFSAQGFLSQTSYLLSLCLT